MVYRATRSDTSPEPALDPTNQGTDPIEPVAKPFVLLVDDDPVVVNLLSRALETEGYRVAALPAESLTVDATLQLERPLAIVVDITAPDVGGFGITQRLAQNATTAGVPLILMSTRSGLKDRRTSRQSKNFLIKPFRPSQLVLILRKIEGGAQL